MNLSYFFFFLLFVGINRAIHAKDVLKTALDLACQEGRLHAAYDLANDALIDEGIRDAATNAGLYHVKSALSLITKGDFEASVALHREGKAIDGSVIPPLAKLHLDNHVCGGISDIFFVAAVVIKQTVDKLAELPGDDHTLVNEGSDADAGLFSHLQEGFQSLITLTSDAGLYRESEALVKAAISSLSRRAVRAPLGGADAEHLSALRFRASLLTPAVFESKKHLVSTRSSLIGRINTLSSLAASKELVVTKLDEFVVSPTFYYVYQGYNDKELLSALHGAYSAANEDVGAVLISAKETPTAAPTAPTEKGRSAIRVGFVSAYYRRHSICKLFCGVISSLANDPFMRVSVTLFSALQENKEDETTGSLVASLPGGSKAFVRIGKTLVRNRHEVTDRDIDVLVYLDVGMDPAIMIWASARLAPVQVCLWGHPATTGLEHMDYFVSSDAYHVDNDVSRKLYQPKRENGADVASAVVDGRMDSSAVSILQYERYTEQLLLFDSLGFHFQRPELKLTLGTDSLLQGNQALYSEHLWRRSEQFYDALLVGGVVSGTAWAPSGHLRELLLERKQGRVKLVLCPQHLPKLHHGLDRIFRGILKDSASTKLVLIVDGAKKGQWRRTLLARWGVSMGPALIKRIVWLENLKPHEYLSLLAVGDLMLDPFPFGGGVTTLESLAVCTPVITLPSEQTVVALAAGQLRRLSAPNPANRESWLEDFETTLIPSTSAHYVANAVSLLTGDNDNETEGIGKLAMLRQHICNRAQRLYDDVGAVADWTSFLRNVA